jgi:hypothetical protein
MEKPPEVSIANKKRNCYIYPVDEGRKRISTEDVPYTPEISQGVVRGVICVAAFAGLRQGKSEGNGGKTTKGISSTSDALCGGLT